MNTQRLRGTNDIRLFAVVGLIAVLVGIYLMIAAAPAAAAADRVLKDGEHFPDGFTVPAGQTWEFNANADTHVTTSGNVVVLGTLRIRPSSASSEHLLQFTNVDESKFIGGGMRHADAPNDIGLWVEEAGVLDISGTPVTPWSYSWAADWSSADDIVAAPVGAGDYSTFTQVNSAAQVPGPNSLGYKPELLNLTRNVRIEGTPGGYTHILINSPNASGPQTIKYAAIRYVAPFFSGEHITGRYGLHFHHNKDGSRGSIVEGVVIRDTDNHAFVPHASHGITFTNTIAYDATSEAYWWDESTIELCGENNEACNETSDLVYDSIVAAKLTPNPANQHGAAAIQLGAGENMTITGSVVTGMQDSGQNVSAYHWPSKDRGIWVFVDNIAHNNETHGIFVWQNTIGEEDENHLIDGFTAYYNGGAGIDHGAYGNSYVYRNLTLLGNATDPGLGVEHNAAIHSHALGKESYTTSGQAATDTQVWDGVNTGGARLLVLGHNVPLVENVRFLFCDFSEIFMMEGRNNAGGYDFIECNLELSDFDRTDIHPGTTIRVQDGNSAYQFTGTGPQQSIAPFYDNPQPPPPPGESGGFLDTANSVFANDIEWLAAEGITQGCNPPLNNQFCPDHLVTRGQMAAFLVRALDLSSGSGNPFSDDDGSIFVTHIEALAEAGITQGCNPPVNSLFCPDQFVTRGQMAAFLVRALDLPAAAGNRFIDDNTSIFEDHIEALASSGITQGCNPPTNNRFCPEASVTRGQMAAFLHRAAAFL